MRFLTWAIRFALFVVLLAFFAAGAVLGVIAVSGAYLAQRREIARLQRVASAGRELSASAASQPPAAEG